MTFLDVTLQKRKPEVVEQKITKPSYDWRFENNINTGKQQLDLETESFDYNKWRTNSSLSNHVDTILFANEMNLNMHITDQMHYDYLFRSIRKTKRYGAKKSEKDKELQKQIKEENEKLALIQEYYKYNTAKARAALRVLTQSQLEIIKRKLEKGGVK